MTKKKTIQEQKSTVAIDWAGINKRVEDTQKLIERGFKPSPKEKQRILKERSKSLAREHESEETTGTTLRVVEFLLAQEMYGIELEYIREIFPFKHITPLPCTPPFVLGIVNLRGQILSVIDIKKFFGLPEKGITDIDKIMIISTDDMELGILAERITGERTIPLSEVQPSLPTLTGIREEYLKGVTGDQLIILDALKILSDKKIVIQEEVEK
ncbi:MAG: purine-binding chemotaxis protein CheW [Candidatus Latescibacteria bacterium]|jgi:purine-binding chemotaxis protein CheW|nr:purine-binding chemotaxis protein CheW [Candidatus Latescibacterota bacterium]